MARQSTGADIKAAQHMAKAQRVFPRVSDDPFEPTEGLLPAIGALRAEIAQVRLALAKQQAILEELLLALRGSTAELVIDEVTDAEARSSILALFKDSSESLFYDDIAERLRLPLRQTVEICNQLEMDGLIGEPTTRH